MRDVVEQFVTGHFGSNLFFGPRGSLFAKAVLPPEDHIGNRASPASCARPAARRQKKGPSPKRRSLPFLELATSLLRSERITQTQHVTRGLVDHAHELVVRTRAPADV